MNTHRNTTIDNAARVISDRPGVEKEMKLSEYGPLRNKMENSLHFEDMPAGGANWGLTTIIQNYVATARVVCNKDLDGLSDWWFVKADIHFSAGFDENANLYEKRVSAEFDKDNLTCDIVIPKCFPIWHADPIQYCFIAIETTYVSGPQDTRCYRFTGTIIEEKEAVYEKGKYYGIPYHYRKDRGVMKSLGLNDEKLMMLEGRYYDQDPTSLYENLEIFTKFGGTLSKGSISEDNCERLLYISQFLETPFARRACIDFLKRKSADVRKRFCWTREYGVYDTNLRKETEDDLLKDTDIRFPKFLQLRELGAISGRFY